MKAMVLAAGLGTRLHPLTNDRPKALVEVGGRTMLEIVLERLRDSGVCEVIVNVHHYADMVMEYLRAHENFGMRIEVSREEELLDTGGGLKKAAWFFLENDEPFLVHNVDVVSTIDLAALVRAHNDRQALATLAVQDRTTSRYLLFDGEGQLCGRRAGLDGTPEMVRDCVDARALAFAGIHVLSPRLLPRMSEEGAFSIIRTYLRLAGEGERVLAFHADEYQWRDLGRPESVAAAGRELMGEQTIKADSLRE
jgi:NDP-sugar pyrophosphorylase family protein